MVAVWSAVVLLAFMVIVGIGVDFAGHAGMAQDARAVADEAARAGGQRLELSSGQARVDVHGAIQAANLYVAGSDFVAVSTVVRGGTEVTVTVRGSYPCRFLSIVGVSSLPVRVTGSADVRSVLGGEQQ